MARRFDVNLLVSQQGVVSTSRGLVGDTTFAVLPTVKPIHTFVITIVFQLVGNKMLDRDFSSYVSKVFPCQIVEDTKLQVFLNCPHVVWLYLVHVWLACP